MPQGKCEICKEAISKYKCPVCLIKFCCVSCYKTHKASGLCEKPQIVPEEKQSDKEQSTEYEFETEDTVKPEKLLFLAKDKDVLQDLENPHLRTLLEHLNSTKNPVQEIEKAMQEPIFAEFATHCLQVVEPEF